jgi:hypothetical protein
MSLMIDIYYWEGIFNTIMYLNEFNKLTSLLIIMSNLWDNLVIVIGGSYRDNSNLKTLWKVY